MWSTGGADAWQPGSHVAALSAAPEDSTGDGGYDQVADIGVAAIKAATGHSGVARLIDAMGLLMDMHATLQVRGSWR